MLGDAGRCPQLLLHCCKFSTDQLRTEMPEHCIALWNIYVDIQIIIQLFRYLSRYAGRTGQPQSTINLHFMNLQIFRYSNGYLDLDLYEEIIRSQRYLDKEWKEIFRAKRASVSRLHNNLITINWCSAGRGSSADRPVGPSGEIERKQRIWSPASTDGCYILHIAMYACILQRGSYRQGCASD